MSLEFELKDGDSLTNQLEAMTRAVDRVSSSLNKLDKASLNKVRSEIQNTTGISGREAIRRMAAEIDGSISAVKNGLNDLSKNSSLQSVRNISKELETALSSMFDAKGRRKTDENVARTAESMRSGLTHIKEILRDESELIRGAANEVIVSMTAPLVQGSEKFKNIAAQARADATRAYQSDRKSVV